MAHDAVAQARHDDETMVGGWKRGQIRRWVKAYCEQENLVVPDLTQEDWDDIGGEIADCVAELVDASADRDSFIDDAIRHCPSVVNADKGGIGDGKKSAMR